MTAPSSLSEIVRLCRARQLPQAEAAIRVLLRAEPDHAQALVLGGDVALALGDRPTAQTRLRRAAVLAEAAAELRYQAAVLLGRAGDVPGAAEALRALAAAHPNAFPVLFDLGQVEEALGRPDAALPAYEAAVRANPGHAGPFTRRAVLLLRRAFGEALPMPPAKRQTALADATRLTMSTLGFNGRFGNQLLQYACLRALGETHGLRVEAPEWIGRWLYDLADPLPSAPLSQLREDGDNVARLLLPGAAPEALRNRDLWGYCCYHTRYFRPHRDLIRRLFAPGARLQPRLDSAMARIHARGRTLVALHLRRGDFGYGRFWIAPERWYLDWLTDLWPTLEQPVLYVASDDPALVGAFAAYRPLAAADLGSEIPGAEFLIDFHVLTQAHALAISNSSFSFAAGLLNANATCFMRPDLAAGRLVAYDPWDADVLLPDPNAAKEPQHG